MSTNQNSYHNPYNISQIPRQKNEACQYLTPQTTSCNFVRLLNIYIKLIIKAMNGTRGEAEEINSGIKVIQYTL
jgi:hypothetical protein